MALLREEAANLLILFIKTEANDVLRNNSPSSVNCPRAELEKFAEKLGVKLEDLSEEWSELCLQKF